MYKKSVAIPFFIRFDKTFTYYQTFQICFHNYKVSVKKIKLCYKLHLLERIRKNNALARESMRVVRGETRWKVVCRWAIPLASESNKLSKTLAIDERKKQILKEKQF
jgi:hypothetical protein